MSLVAELVALALGIGVAYLVVTDSAAPAISSWPASWRFALFLFVTTFATQVFRTLLGLLTPLFEGNATALEVISFLGAALLVLAVARVYLVVGNSIPPRR